MIELRTLNDPILIEHFLYKDDLYKNVLGTSQFSLEYIKDKRILLVSDSNVPIGVVLLNVIDKNYVMFHGGIFKDKRGNSLKYLKKCIKLLKRILFPFHIITQVKEDNIPAIKLVEKVFKFKKLIKLNDGNNYRLYSE